MAEYIERDNYCKNICLCNEKECDKEKCSIHTAPAADVVEVVHAYWDKDSVTGAMCCSNCRMPPPGDAELEDFYESDYCQSCGAKMDGKGG